jgi:hypothetical protein
MAKDEFAEFRSPDDASFDKLVAAIDRAYHRPGLMLWRSFCQGLMSAIGMAIGWILIISVSGYLFQALGGINLLKPWIEKAQQGIISAQTKSLKEASQLQQGN